MQWIFCNRVMLFWVLLVLPSRSNVVLVVFRLAHVLRPWLPAYTPQCALSCCCSRNFDRPARRHCERRDTGGGGGGARRSAADFSSVWRATSTLGAKPTPRAKIPSAPNLKHLQEPDNTYPNAERETRTRSKTR